MRKTKYPKVTTLEFSISDFSQGIDAVTDENVTDFDKAVSSYNFEYKNGALTESIGFENLTTPDNENEGCTETLASFVMGTAEKNFVKIAHFKEFSETYQERQDKIFLLTNENKLFYTRVINRVPVFSELPGLTFTAAPTLKTYNDETSDCILFFSDADKVQSWDNIGVPKNYTNAPLVHDFCEYKGRIFAILSGERLKIRSEETNFLQWSQSTTSASKIITFDSERGYINKLLSFNGYLFAIRDFGISRIIWYDADSSFDVKHLLSSGSRIYANTACVCGNSGLVLCKDGIYEFDNVSAKKLDTKLNRMFQGVSNQNAVASFRNGIYYLACRLNFGDNKTIGCEVNQNYKNNALISYDTQTNQYSITRGVDISYLCTIQFLSADKLLACFNGSNCDKIGQLASTGLMFGENETKFWTSPLTDLGYSNKIKYVKEVSVLSLYDIKLKVFSECEEREFNIKGGNIISRVPIRIKGKQIGLSISSTTQKAYVSNLKLLVNLIDNEYV